MSEIWMISIISISGYLIGSISMSRIVTKIVSPDTNLDDVDFTIPSGEKYHIRNISATTASIKLGPKVGGLITILDALKAVIPVLVLKFIFPDQYYFLIVAVFVVIGHNWSIFHRFTGGAGLSVSYGAFFTVDFLGTLLSAFSGMFIGFLVFKDMMVAFTLGPILMLLWLIIFHRDWPHIIFGLTLVSVVILKMLPDMIKLSRDEKNHSEDISSIMDQTGMGRGMKKIMKWLGVDPDKKES